MPSCSSPKVLMTSRLKVHLTVFRSSLLASEPLPVVLKGLRSLSDDIVFLHLTMAFLSDECTVPLRALLIQAQPRFRKPGFWELGDSGSYAIQERRNHATQKNTQFKTARDSVRGAGVGRGMITLESAVSSFPNPQFPNPSFWFPDIHVFPVSRITLLTSF